MILLLLHTVVVKSIHSTAWKKQIFSPCMAAHMCFIWVPIENLRFQWSHLSGDSSVGYQYGFQSVFKNLPNVSMVFKLCVSKCFQIMCFNVFSKVLIGFNGFQIMCFKVFSKFSHRFQWFSNCIFSKCVSKCFQIVCFKVFSKFLIGFNGFQIVCFKLFPNNVFQSVFKILP